jgi:hypothetical protein
LQLKGNNVNAFECNLSAICPNFVPLLSVGCIGLGWSLPSFEEGKTGNRKNKLNSYRKNWKA